MIQPQAASHIARVQFGVILGSLLLLGMSVIATHLPLLHCAAMHHNSCCPCLLQQARHTRCIQLALRLPCSADKYVLLYIVGCCVKIRQSNRGTFWRSEREGMTRRTRTNVNQQQVRNSWWHNNQG